MSDPIADADRLRLKRRMAELSRIGADGDGLSRIGLSVEEESGRDLVASWLTALGGRPRRDAALNLWCRFGGEGPAVILGSHLDSVPHGGRYDGTLGVLCAVEAMEILAASRLRLARPVETVSWSYEEGARFGVGLFGSSAAFGYLPKDVGDRRDRDGTSVRDALAALGAVEPPAAARRAAAEVLAYVEPHIEQGPRLAQSGTPLGIVKEIVGLVHGSVTVLGQQDHAGTTPMADRLDAFAGAVEIALALESVARAHTPAVATIGEIAVRPGAQNVVPGACTFSIDVRAPTQPTIDLVMAALRAAVDAAASARHLKVSLDVHDIVPPVPLDPGIRDVLARAAATVGVDAPLLTSGAVHDAANLQRAGVRTGMLFIRSTGGSHTPTEHASMDDAALAAPALVVALRTLAA